MSYQLYSHPDKLLKDHLLNSYKRGMQIFCKHNLFQEKEELLKTCLLFHDLGKASDFFQQYIDPTKKNPNEKYKRHSEISALWAYLYLRSLGNHSQKDCLFAYIVIKKHHNDLHDFRDNLIGDLDETTLSMINNQINYKELRNIYQNYLEDIDCIKSETFAELIHNGDLDGCYRESRKVIKELNLDDYILLNYMFSILIFADKEDAIFTDSKPLRYDHNIWESVFIRKFKESYPKTGSQMDKLRNNAFEEATQNLNLQENILSLNIPTGSGKTINALHLALNLKERQTSIERVIYCLPFTSIIDQNEKVFENILLYNDIKSDSDILLKHHHLSELEYVLGEDNFSGQEAEFLIETWESELVITTFYQLLHSLLSNRNKALKKFHNLANSVIILDEVQAIPHKYWLLIKEILQKASNLLNFKVILVTATMPLIFSEEKREIFELVKNKQRYFQSLDRIELNLEYLDKPRSINEMGDILCDQIRLHNQQSHLIICNTIKSAHDLYKRISAEFKEFECLFLSSYVIPKQRMERIELIKKNPEGKIIVSTQLVEAGVDIDIDFVYRDFAPLDSIFQSCGRCNRNNSKNKSTVFLFELINQNNKPFHSMIYDQVLTTLTKKCFSGKDCISEKDFYHLSEDYYALLKNCVSQDESIKLIRDISMLSYETAFESKERFQLIDSFETVTTLIEFDEIAQNLYLSFLEAKNNKDLNPYDKKHQLKSIFRKMTPYLINIQKRYSNGNTDFYYISNEMLSTCYSSETGFKLIQENEDYIL